MVYQWGTMTDQHDNPTAIDRTSRDASAAAAPRGTLLHIGDMPSPGSIEDGEWEAGPGRGFAIIEMSIEDLRRAPLYKVVELREVDSAVALTHVGAIEQ